MIKPVEFTVEKETLRGNFYIPEGVQKPPVVILFHGSGSKGEKYPPLARSLMNNGIFTFFFNFRGCGKSDGNFYEQTIGGATRDAKKAIDFLLEQNVDHEKIGMVGGSFGGDIALKILPEYPIKSLILLAPSATDREENILIDMGSEEDEHNYFFYHEEKWGKSKNFENIKNFDGELLIIEGSNDNIIPHTLTQKYYDSATLSKNKKLEVIKGADHRLSQEKWTNEFTDMSLEWFLETL